MSARRGMIAVAVVAALGISGLLLAAGSDGRSTAFSLDIPPAGPVATLHKGQAACQGPFTATAAFGFVTPWISPFQAPGVVPEGAVPGAALAVTVRDAATSESIATGRVTGGYLSPIAPTVALTRTIPAGRNIRVCLRSRGPSVVQLLGAALPTSVAAADDGRLNRTGGAAIALLFRRRQPQSLLSLIPTVFDRAALFRPGWVGAWTYWLLCAGLLGAFALGALAVSRAARSDVVSTKER